MLCKAVAMGRYFSNFATSGSSGFTFQLPSWLLQLTDATFDSEVYCEFSEKAIMLCKAVAMGDEESFVRIAAAERRSVASGGLWSRSRGRVSEVQAVVQR